MNKSRKKQSKILLFIYLLVVVYQSVSYTDVFKLINTKSHSHKHHHHTTFVHVHHENHFHAGLFHFLDHLMESIQNLEQETEDHIIQACNSILKKTEKKPRICSSCILSNTLLYHTVGAASLPDPPWHKQEFQQAHFKHDSAYRGPPSLI